jgi:mono/diheme cytochrome c family protein
MISRTIRAWSAGFVGLGMMAIAAAFTGCKPLPPSKPAAQFTAEEARGAQVFQVDCARCHYPTSTRGLKGPGLQALTKLKSMPSGAPPSDERMIQTILHGHGMMPAVPVSDDDLADLLAYLHTL